MFVKQTSSRYTYISPMAKKPLFALIIACSMLFSALLFNWDRLRIELAIYRAQGYYARNSHYLIPLDSHKILTLTLAQRPSLANPEIEQMLANSLEPENPFLRWNDKNHPVGGFNLERAADTGTLENIDSQTVARYFNDFYRVPEEFREYLPHHWDDVLLKAIYCDLQGYDNTDFNLLTALPDGQGGYADTHIYLALLFLRANGCFDQSYVNQELDALAQNILVALEEDREFSDLYGERIAFLYWGGYGSQVKGEWIDLILNHQKGDGGWGDKSDESNPHTTGFALLSLLYHLEGSPQQPFW